MKVTLYVNEFFRLRVTTYMHCVPTYHSVSAFGCVLHGPTNASPSHDRLHPPHTHTPHGLQDTETSQQANVGHDMQVKHVTVVDECKPSVAVTRSNSVEKVLAAFVPPPPRELAPWRPMIHAEDISALVYRWSSWMYSVVVSGEGERWAVRCKCSGMSL